jgi:predicted metalloprotease with PDZ domain
VHSTAELPLPSLLQDAGAKVTHEKAPLAQQLGLRVAETNGSVVLKTVLRGSAAEAAGMAPGDEWLAIELPAVKRGTLAEAWRIHKLDEVAELRGVQPTLTAVVSRDRRLLRCVLQWPTESQTVRLGVADAARLAPWLQE